jgi:DNA-binding PadR family transcriptional regulator
MSDFNISNIDPVFHSRYRLGIVALLSGGDEIEFNFFKKELKITEGNLSVHLRKLEDNSFITINKQFKNRKPRTSYRITEKGLRHYRAYLEEIGKLLLKEKKNEN